jgi:uncharacterized protein
LFRFTLLLVVFLVQYVLFLRVWHWLKETRPANRLFRGMTIGLFVSVNACFLLIVVIRPHLVELPEWVEIAGMYPFYIWYGATFFMGLVLLVAALIKLPFKAILWLSTRSSRARARLRLVMRRPAYREFDATRRVFLRRGMYSLTAVSFGGTAYGTIVGRNHPELTTAEFPIASLPPALDGFTIALASDVHSSIFMTKHEMDEYVTLLNDMKADLVVVTGDFVNSLTEEVYPFAEAFSALKAPHGVYGVMGNHDFFASNPDLVAREVNDCGVRLLRNDRVTISREGAQFDLLGVDDTGNAGRSAEYMRAAARGIQSRRLPRVLLCHRPYFLAQAAEQQIDLMLSGHTHGGQIVLATFGNTCITPAALASHYVWGKYQRGNTAMYVSRGIGTVGLPVRINCRPEITKITLRSGPGGMHS